MEVVYPLGLISQETLVRIQPPQPIHKDDTMTETHKRTIARAITYRIVATLITAIFTGISTAIFLHIILTVIHYLMERVWLRIKWGRIE